MTHIRSLLFGGVCSMAVMSCFVAVDIGYAASAVKNSDNDSAHLVRVADNSSQSRLGCGSDDESRIRAG